MKIKTARRTIRPFQECDITAFMDYRNDLDWMQYQGFKGLSRKEHEAALLGSLKLQQGIQLAVISNESQALIGDQYLRPENDQCWIDCTITRSEARRGYDGEAVSAVTAALQQEGITSFLAEVDKMNIASAALFKKLGFTCIETQENYQIYSLILLALT